MDLLLANQAEFLGAPFGPVEYTGQPRTESTKYETSLNRARQE